MPNDVPPPPDPPPVLPYRGDGGEERLPLPPAASIRRVFGIVALSAAVAAWLLAVGAAVQSASGDRDAVNIGCSLGGMTWVVSITIAVSVASRDRGVGRRYALAAVVLDLLLLVATLATWNAKFR